MNAIRILNSVKLLTTKEQKKAPDCEGLVPIYGLPAKHLFLIIDSHNVLDYQQLTD